MYNHIKQDTIYNYLGKDNPDLIKELLGLILNVNMIELEELNELYQKEDFKTIKKRVHKAKPSLGYIGADETLKLIHQIEADLEASAPINVLLQEHVVAIKQEINTFLNDL